MTIVTIGLDLAKTVFQVHCVDENGRAVVRRQVRRADVATFFGNLPRCLVGMGLSVRHHLVESTRFLDAHNS